MLETFLDVCDTFRAPQAPLKSGKWHFLWTSVFSVIKLCWFFYVFLLSPVKLSFNGKTRQTKVVVCHFELAEHVGNIFSYVWCVARPPKSGKWHFSWFSQFFLIEFHKWKVEKSTKNVIFLTSMASVGRGTHRGHLKMFPTCSGSSSWPTTNLVWRNLPLNARFTAKCKKV